MSKFKSVQITGSYKAVAKQLKAEGFTTSYEGNDYFNCMYNGEKLLAIVKTNKDIDQVCSLTLRRSDIERDSADEVSENFNALCEKFEKELKYTPDRTNKKANGAASFDPNISIGMVISAVLFIFYISFCALKV